MAAAVALENLRIIEEENLIDRVRNDTGQHLRAKWQGLAEHPLVGEATIVGMMGSLALTPHKDSRAAFASESGTVGLIARELSFKNNLIMRHVGDRMIISPPLVISRDEIDTLAERAWKTFDQLHVRLKDEGLLKAAS